MKSSLAVLWRDLASVPRRKRFYLKRGAVVVAGGIALIWGLWSARYRQGSAMGLVIFSSLSMSCLTALAIISVTSACWAVLREKEDRTIGLLFLSDISCRGFVLGKMSTCLFSTAMVVLSTMPLFMLAISLGGISMGQVLMAFALLLSTMYLGTGMGLLGACVCNETKRANSFVALLFVVWFIVLPIGITARMAMVNSGPSMDKVLAVVSPFVAMGSINYGQMFKYVGMNCGVSIILGSVCVVLANAILPHRIVSKERQSLIDSVREKMRGHRKARKWIVPPRINGNPVAWKDLNYFHGGMRSTVIKFFVSFGIVLIIAVVIGAKVNPNRPEDTFKLALWFEFMFCLVVFALGSVSHFGLTFNRERRSRTLEVLLTSGLTDSQIVKGKIVAVMKSLLPWLIGFVACGFIMLATFGIDDYFWDVFAIFVVELTSMWFAYCAIAMWMSLKFKRAVAFPTCILLFLLWNTFGRVITASIMIAGADYQAVVAIDAIIHITLGIVFLAKTSISLRSIAAQTD